jgi:hypothetical protein
MWMVEDAQAGRLYQGKSHQGPPDEMMTLEISGRRVYQLQKYLEEKVSRGGEFVEMRILVMLHEELGAAVARAQEKEKTEELCHGGEVVQRPKAAPQRGKPASHHTA